MLANSAFLIEGMLLKFTSITKELSNRSAQHRAKVSMKLHYKESKRPTRLHKVRLASSMYITIQSRVLTGPVDNTASCQVSFATRSIFTSFEFIKYPTLPTYLAITTSRYFINHAASTEHPITAGAARSKFGTRFSRLG